MTKQHRMKNDFKLDMLTGMIGNYHNKVQYIMQISILYINVLKEKYITLYDLIHRLKIMSMQ